MKIDKARFLFLTTSIAASAAVALVATSGCSTTATQTDAGSSSTTDGGGDDDGSTADGGDNGDAGDGAAECLSNKGPAPVCYAPIVEGMDAAVDDGGADGGTDAKCAAECDGYATRYKSDVAAAINACLEMAPTCEGSGPGCVDQVLPSVCDDPEVTAFCTPLVQGCAEAGGNVLTQQACEQIAKALNADGRAAFTSCVTEGGGAGFCATDSALCVDAAKSPY